MLHLQNMLRQIFLHFSSDLRLTFSGKCPNWLMLWYEIRNLTMEAVSDVIHFFSGTETKSVERVEGGGSSVVKGGGG